MDRNNHFRAIRDLFRKVLDSVALRGNDPRCGKMAQLIVSDSNDLINAGEEGIACENMVSNLDEFAVPLSKEVVRDIGALCEMMSLTPTALSDLDKLVVDD